MKSVACLILLLALVIAIASASNPESLGPYKGKQQSGYITVPGFNNDDGTHLFYWFFESVKPTKHTILWLTGGPGCSGMLALFVENGPYKIDQNLNLTLNPYGWNEAANIIFIDQPVGTGFSYADSPNDYVTNEEQVAEDLYEFLQKFFKMNPQYQSNQFHIIGESFAGHYVPATAKRVVDGNKNLKTGDIKIDMTSIAIGNGLVNPKVQYGTYASFLHKNDLLDEISTIAYNDVAYPLCEAAIDTGLLSVAFVECNLASQSVFSLAEAEVGHSLNVYDVTEKCTVPPLCYNLTNVGAYLNQPHVKTALGANTKIEWESCDTDVYTGLTSDFLKNYEVAVPHVLDAGVRVLVYSGRSDWICNWLGGQAWVNAMEWPGQEGYLHAPEVSWHLDNKTTAGDTRTFKNLTTLWIDNAGHMVPMNQPGAALQMVKTLLNNEAFN